MENEGLKLPVFYINLNNHHFNQSKNFNLKNIGLILFQW